MKTTVRAEFIAGSALFRSRRNNSRRRLPSTCGRREQRSNHIQEELACPPVCFVVAESLVPEEPEADARDGDRGRLDDETQRARNVERERQGRVHHQVGARDCVQAEEK
jgi:hypothetical protein